MLNETYNDFKTGFKMLIVFIVITGLIYPLLITGINQTLFHNKANGSLVNVNGKLVGSLLIGQSFTGDQFFNSRPSATTPFAYNPLDSRGSNFATTNPELAKHAEPLILKFHKYDNESKIPIDLVTSSGSGLDPHISVAGAYLQAPIIAKSRNISESKLIALIKQYTINPFNGFTGNPYVNVLQLNLELLKVETDDYEKKA